MEYFRIEIARPCGYAFRKMLKNVKGFRIDFFCETVSGSAFDWNA